MPRHWFILFTLWAIALLVALSLDFRIAQAVHSSGLGRRVEGKGWAQVIKEPGEFQFTIAVSVMLALARRIRWKQAIFVLLAGVASGTNFILKWVVGRYRPYKLPSMPGLHPFEFLPCGHGLHGLFNQHDLCFPSGHECTAATLATAMVLVWPRGAWVFVMLAVCVGIERPAENAHYASDVIGAAGFAMLTTTLLHRLLWGWLHPVQTQAQA
jgi:membrane-associated phospholipid phosphatase